MVEHTVMTEDGEKFVEIRIRRRLDAKGDFLGWEQELADELQEACCVATAAQLEALDTSGEPLIDGEGTKWTSKGQVLTVVECPGGAISVSRHVYQPSWGGMTRAPMDERVGLIGSATPRFAKTLASKIAESPAPSVMRDLAENHARKVSDSYCQDTAERVHELAQTNFPLSQWEPDSHYLRVAKIVVGVDGAMLNIRKEAWRQAQCGTFSLYNRDGTRLETIYLARGPGATAPLGKEAFFADMEIVLQKLKDDYPQAEWLGLSDAASDFEAWLKTHTSEWMVDYHHATEYITKASAAFGNYVDRAGDGAAHFASQMRHKLRDEKGGAAAVLKEFSDQKEIYLAELSAPALAGLDAAITYFTNHLKHMNYAQWIEQQRPIGSGPTEAACKTIIKDRMTKSGMRWSIPVSDRIIALRSLFKSTTRWAQFWIDHTKNTLSQAL